MRIIRIVAVILCGISSSYAQQDDLITRFGKQAIANDSLTKVIKNYEQSDTENQVKIQNLQDSINNLKSDLAKLENFKAEKIKIENQLKQKNDSITVLQSNLLDKEKQLKTQEQNTIQKVREARESSKGEIVSGIVGNYKNKTFDDLIKSTTQKSIRNDRRIIGNSTDIEPLLSNLEKYYSVKELLESKFDASKIKDVKNELNQIKFESRSLALLKSTVEKYQIFNAGLREVIQKIMALDEKESVVNMPKEIQNEKFNKIMADISYYLFNYDFNFLDYPYLSDIVLEVIKRKAPNPDADISDILMKL